MQENCLYNPMLVTKERTLDKQVLWLCRGKTMAGVLCRMAIQQSGFAATGWSPSRHPRFTLHICRCALIPLEWILTMAYCVDDTISTYIYTAALPGFSVGREADVLLSFEYKPTIFCNL